MYQDQFIKAINDKTHIRLTFYSKEDGGQETRLCAPMDYGLSRRKLKINGDMYHMMDFKGKDGMHNLSLFPNQVIRMEFLVTKFDPATFITWTPNWWIKRDWGKYS